MRNRDVGTTAAANPRLTLLVLGTGCFFYLLLQAVVAPTLPLLRAELHTSQRAVTWLLTAYLVSASVFTPILGRAGDLLGKKKVLVAVLATLVLGSALAAVAASLPVLLAARIIQGVGAGVVPLSFGIVREQFPPRQVASAVSVLASTMAVGGGIALIIAGPIVESLGYHWLFWLPTIALALATLLALAVVTESPRRSAGTVNWRAALLLSGWLVAMLLAVSNGPAWGWHSPLTLSLFAVSVVLGGSWIRAELHSEQPLIDMAMMRIRVVWLTNVATALLGAALFSFSAVLPQFLQTPSHNGYGFGSSVTGSGLLTLPLAAGNLAAGTVAGRLCRRYGAASVLLLGAVISTPAYLGFAVAHAHPWQVEIWVALLGAGFGFSYSGAANLIVSSVPAHQSSSASGVNANARTIGGAFGTATVTSILTTGLLASGYPTESSYVLALLTLAVVSLGCVAAATAILAQRTQRRAEFALT